VNRPLAWTALVTVLLLMPLPAGFLPSPGRLAGGLAPDVLVHLALFAALSRAWLGGARSERPALALAGVAAMTAFGGLLELLQPAVGRSAEGSDLAADAAGALAGWAWAWRSARRAL